MRLENNDSLLLFNSFNCKKRMIVCRNNKHTNNNGIIRLTEKKVKTIQFKLIFRNNKYKVTKPKKNTISNNDKEFNNIKVFPAKLNTILITTNIIIKSFPKIVNDKIEITSKKNKKIQKIIIIDTNLTKKVTTIAASIKLQCLLQITASNYN